MNRQPNSLDELNSCTQSSCTESLKISQFRKFIYNFLYFNLISIQQIFIYLFTHFQIYLFFHQRLFNNSSNII